MFWETVKNVLRKNSGTCIIVENGKPEYVVVKFEEYEKMLDAEPRFTPKENMGEQELLEKINQEINNWKAKQETEAEEINLSEDQDTEANEIRIENLPIA